MGATAGNIPGQGSPDMTGTPVSTVDHTGQSIKPGSKQVPLSFDVDEDCVNDLIKPGRALGEFAPVVNDCQGFAGAVLAACKIQTTKPSIQSPQALRSPRRLNPTAAMQGPPSLKPDMYGPPAPKSDAYGPPAPIK
ncbi:hypothetical protein D3C85_1245910 [compost metagenome]